MNGSLALRKAWIGGAALVLGFVPATASADHPRLGVGFSIGAQRAGVWVPPIYETVARTVTVPAVYEDRIRQVWREPVYQERRVPVEIPADVIDRHVPKYDHFGHIIGVEHITEVVRPARTEWRVERVCISEGRFETITERVLVQPETTRIVYEKVLVRPGYWAPPGRHLIGKSYGRHVGFHVDWHR